jgi:hypothetical protein
MKKKKTKTKIGLKSILVEGANNEKKMMAVIDRVC